MTRNEALLESLQNRWLCGETLSPDEEQERQRLIQADPLTQRELEILEQLRDSVGVAKPGEDYEALVRSVLEEAWRERERRLRLVTGDEEPRVFAPEASRAVRGGVAGGRWGWPKRVLVASAAVAAATAALWANRAVEPSLSETAGPAPVLAGSPVADEVSPPQARVELVLASGAVKVDGHSAQVGEGTLKVGQRIATEEGRACLTIEPTIDVCMRSQTELRLTKLESADIRVEVLRGGAVSQLEKRPKGQRFSLVAGHVRATAIGTVFAVEHAAAEAQVTVLKGRVAVAVGERNPVVVKAHNRLKVEKGAVASPHVTSPHGTSPHGASPRVASPHAVGRGEEATYWAQLANDAYWQPTELGVVHFTSKQAGDSVVIDDDKALPLPLQTFLPSGEHRVIVKSSEHPPTEIKLLVEVGQTQDVDVSRLVEEALNQRQKAASQAPAPSQAPGVSQALGVELGPRELLEKARAERQKGNIAGALSRYKRLRAKYPASPEAHTVQVTLGKLELSGNRPGLALVYFNSYLKRGGDLAPEARAGKIRALQALGRTSDERKAIREYLRLYPNGFFAPALRQRLQVLSGG